MRDLRTVNHTAGQKIEADEVLKRIGDMSYRNFGTFAKMFLFDSGKALIVGDGIRVEPSSGMTVNIPAGNFFQKIGDDVIPCLQVEDQTVTLDAADGVARIDIIEAQIKSISDKDDYANLGTVTDGEITFAQTAIHRDIKYYLSCQKQKGTTTPTAATAGSVTGTVNLSGTINLSSVYLLNISDGEDGNFQEIDCRGAVPNATTRAEIIAAINAAVGRTMASASGNYLALAGNGTGQQSRFTIKPPDTDSSKDALNAIMGLSVAGLYKYTYTGTNAWVKIAEIDVGTATTTITAGLIRNIDKKSTWASENDEIILMRNHVSNSSYIKKTIQDFIVASGQTVTAGDVVEFINGTVQKGSGNTATIGSESAFESASTAYVSAVAIDDNKVFIAYQDTGNSSYGTAIVGTISGTTITWGNPVVFESATTSYISVCSISRDKVLVAYRDVDNSGYGTAIVATISGTVPTFGSPVVFESAATLYISACTIDKDKVFVAYQDAGNSYYGTAIVATISGTVPTFGSPVVFESASTAVTSSCALSSNKVFIAYQDTGNSGYGTAIVATISGTVPTFGGAVVFESASTNYISACTIDKDKVFIAYQDTGDSSNGAAVVGTVTNGWGIRFSTPMVFTLLSTASYCSAKLLKKNIIVVCYYNGTNATCISLTLTGDDSALIAHAPVGFGAINSGNTAHVSLTIVSENSILIAYQDTASSSYGRAAVVTISQLLGIAQTGGAAGETVQVVVDGISDVHSGLASGRPYWSNAGSLMTFPPNMGPYIGEALSNTELLIKRDMSW